MHLLVHSGWESGYGPRPGSRFGLIPTSLSPPRHAPHRLPSPSPLSPASFSGLTPRLVVVHSRNGVEELLDHGISYPPLVGGEIEPGPTAVSASTRPSLPLPLPFQIQTSYRCFPRPSRLRRQVESSAATWITRRQFAERGFRRRWIRPGMAVENNLPPRFLPSPSS